MIVIIPSVGLFSNSTNVLNSAFAPLKLNSHTDVQYRFVRAGHIPALKENG